MPAPVYADWKAPRSDRDILIWPDAARLFESIRNNLRLLAGAQTSILGVPLAEARAATRTFLGHDSPAPLVLTGHQVELHHPGVWIKNAVIHHLARLTDGRAMHLAVDTDQPKHLTLRYPTHRDGQTPPASIPLTDDPDLTDALWSGRLSAPTPVHATQLERQVLTDAAEFGFTPAIAPFLAAIRRASLEEGVLPPVLVGALHQLDWSLGLRYDAILASPLWDSPGFLLLAAHLIAHARDYALAYNNALARYRTAENIDNPGRPMPDLPLTATTVELPFWLDDHTTGSRTRLTVTLAGSSFSLTVAGDTFTPNPPPNPTGGWDTAADLRAFLRRHNHRLAPRALTLTTFARLFIADLFVHGIGGGRYDQVTDLTLESFFNLTPPAFAVATGTLYFPWATGRPRVDLPKLVHQGHHLKHNLLPASKKSFLNAIAAAPPHSTQRQRAFLDLHAELARERRTSPALSAFTQSLAAAQARAAQDAVIFDRELFYALQPTDRLTAWIDKTAELLAVPQSLTAQR